MLTIVNKTSNSHWRKYDKDLNIIFEDILKVHNLKDKDLSLILTKSKYIRNINKIYRNKDYATDVISFASCDDSDNYDTDYLGDIFINVDKVIEQAKQLGHSERREISFLLMHGVLHCLGYDHIESKDEKIMIKKQQEIIKGRDYLDEKI